jgi:CRP/FNR family cyclic AMP-dependent transcriptional regulator
VAGLRSIEWLRELSTDEWASLTSRATRHEFSPGTTVFAPTSAPHSVYLLESGRVRILRLSRGGDEVTLGYVVSGEVFGELPGMGDHPRESYAVARERSIVWRIPLDLFRGLIGKRPTVGLEIGRQMSDRMKRVEARVENLVFGDVRARLAMVLLELAEDFGERAGDRWIIELALSQGELATLIGSTRQSVNAALSALRDDGLLQLDQGRVEVLDAAALRRVGESNGAAEP